MIITKKLIPALLSLCIFLPFSAPAMSDGLYIGAGVYRSDNDAGDDTTGGGALGYTFIDTNIIMLSVEGGYYDFGKTSNNSQSIEADALTVGGVVALPLGPFFELYAKGGIARIDGEIRSTNSLEKGNEDEFYVGGGASIDILDTIDIYAEYIAFDGDFDTNIAGVGIKISF
ncbi:MAG: outer membrane beta-barrel protein [Pseudomonadota bacterium]